MEKAIDTNDILVEYKKVEANLKELQEELRVKNDEIQRLKQATLISTGAKMTLGKLLGVNTTP